MKKKLIQPILYERIEQKKVIERELFSKLTPKEKGAMAKSWMKFTNEIGKAGDEARATEAKAKKKGKGKK